MYALELSKFYDQSLCYVGGRTHSSFVAIPIWIATYVIVFSLTVNND
jgi:hypothetical protein